MSYFKTALCVSLIISTGMAIAAQQNISGPTEIIPHQNFGSSTAAVAPEQNFGHPTTPQPAQTEPADNLKDANTIPGGVVGGTDETPSVAHSNTAQSAPPAQTQPQAVPSGPAAALPTQNNVTGSTPAAAATAPLPQIAQPKTVSVQ
jgi:hypothetical protein